ncbi:mitochondrial GTPase related protein Gep3 [Schizosaccharomyces osmophilus]|uniref:Mitochondrial GTPase related protein Gep3 n=1 Tax=Schizosaccharomyces osmophilus TaxID=2545709 RepID=A0AAF0AUA4_9SCHI|nr:mitochondrial GTPase related protein Gep3 [Schizosaccharomyces osmophilus]WBW71402.1 mitochondrial GTPase related protein Gep3 [Schizosaccharomyces osmophilus]
MTMQNFCRGCGHTLQSLNPKAGGFKRSLKPSVLHLSPQTSRWNSRRNEQSIFEGSFSKLDPKFQKLFPKTPSVPIAKEKTFNTHLWCQRCHDIKFYNRFQQEDLLQEPTATLTEVIKGINADPKTALVLQITDVSDLNPDHFISAKTLTDFPVFHVFSHVDTLPRPNASWLFQALGLVPENAMLLTARGSPTETMKELLTNIQRLLTPGGHVYIIGEANSGKSSLIQSFAQYGNGLVKELSMESFIPGTTLKSMPFSASSFGSTFTGLKDGKVIDTPGYSGTLGSLLPWIDSKIFKELVPKVRSRKKQLQSKPLQVPIYSAQSILFGGLVRVTPMEISAEEFVDMEQRQVQKNQKINLPSNDKGVSSFHIPPYISHPDYNEPLLAKIFTKIPFHISSTEKIKKLEQKCSENSAIQLVTRAPSKLLPSFLTYIQPKKLHSHVYDSFSNGELLIHNFGFVSFDTPRPFKLLIEAVNPLAVSWRPSSYILETPKSAS